MAYRLLQNETAVLGLLDGDRLPFPERAPKYIRARLYTYHFTAEFRTKDWWTRKLKQVGENLISIVNGMKSLS